MTTPSIGRPPSRLASLGAGVLLAVLPAVLGLAIAGSSPGATRGPVAGEPLLWACDRDAGLLVRLDRRLLPVDGRRLPHPVRVVPLPDGGAWALCVLEGRAGGGHRLVRLGADLAVRSAFELDAVADLAVDGDGAAWVLEVPPGGAARVLRRAEGQPDRAPLEVPRARALAVAEGWLAVGDAAGRLRLWGPAGEQVVVELAGELGPILPAPGGWWVVAGEGALLFRLAREGSLLASSSLDVDAPRLALASEDGLWIVGTRGLALERRDGLGRPLLVRTGLPAVVLGALAADGEGGLVVSGPGTLLALDPLGELRAGQGGFERLSDVAWGRAR